MLTQEYLWIGSTTCLAIMALIIIRAVLRVRYSEHDLPPSRAPRRPSMRDIYPRPSLITAAATSTSSRNFFSRQGLVLMGIFLGLTISFASLTLSAQNSQRVSFPLTDWYHDAWNTRHSLTINHALVAEDLTNFPTLIAITNIDLPLFADSATGRDIVFTDSSGITKLDHDIEKYDPHTHTLLAWVKLPRLSASQDTTIYLYYGNPEATDQSTPRAVWSEGYAAVYLLHDKATPAIDTSQEINSLAYLATTGTAKKAPGKIGGGLLFQGAQDVVDIGATSDKAIHAITAPFTLSAWIKPSTLGGTILGKRDSQGTQWQFSIDETGRLHLRESETGTWIGHSSQGTSVTRVTKDEWHYVAVTVDEHGTPTFYNNDRTEVGSKSSGTFTPNTTTVAIGAQWSIYPSTTHRFRGVIDNVRIAAQSRTADWIKTEYANQVQSESFVRVDSSPQKRPDDVPTSSVSRWFK